MGRITVTKLWNQFENNTAVTALHNGMLLAIPAVMAGSFAVLLNNLPIPGYGALLQRFAGGFLPSLFSVVYSVTLNTMPLILLLTISYSYADLKKSEGRDYVSVSVLCAYMAFAVDPRQGLSMDIFQNSWLFFAVFFALGFSWLFDKLCSFYAVFMRKGSGGNFLINAALSKILPACLLLAVAVLLRTLCARLIGSVNLQTYVTEFWLNFFEEKGRRLSSAVLFSFLNQVLWFFGIHGSNVLDVAAKELFEIGIEMNEQLIAAGQVPTEILSKSFMDVFVFFGGCGTALCLLTASLFFLRKNQLRDLSKVALLPALFNINEIILFGFPVMLNPLLLVPFIAVPCLLTCISWAACANGLVPPVSHHVGWTVPVFLSGYAATGSLRGSLLQLFNLLVGTAVYVPFVRYYQRVLTSSKKSKVTILENYIKDCEKTGEVPSFNDTTASLLVINQLEHDMDNNLPEMYYQPQYDYTGRLTGAEALLRWNMADVGFVYPPLVIALADAGKGADKLDELIIRKVCANVASYHARNKTPIEFSFNISASQLASPHLMPLLEQVISRFDFGKNRLCLEVTEQAVFKKSAFLIDRLKEIRKLGLQLSMDDFGMGHTSLVHLSNNVFDQVKLDGSLIQGLTDNPRCADIITSIVGLSRSMHFDIVAEFVETAEQRDKLHALGCDKYQGYLYSKPLPFDEFINLP